MLRRSDLQGYSTPTSTMRVVVTMFADDTTVYLSEKDDFQTLTSILTKWCAASGAKFNISKTEIIQIGSEEYHAGLIDTHRLHSEGTPIPDHMNVATDGRATRILRAWIGNKTDEQAIWSLTIDKINCSLERWNRFHPTLEGRKIIIQRTIGGMTQYLAKAQGMPKEIKRTLTKTLRSFAWDTGGSPTVNAGML
ncbi:hypothetical protein PAXINDRAFT_57935, partial [Paxillus involutus ATCC 200175]